MIFRIIFIYITFHSFILAASEDTIFEAYDLYADPICYVDGVNVITGRFTYSVTDAVIPGIHPVQIIRTYSQGKKGNLATCWDYNCSNNLIFSGCSYKFLHGPLTGIPFLPYSDKTFCLDPKVFLKGLTNAKNTPSGQSNLKNNVLRLSDKCHTAIHIDGYGVKSEYKRKNDTSYFLSAKEYPDGCCISYDGNHHGKVNIGIQHNNCKPFNIFHLSEEIIHCTLTKKIASSIPKMDVLYYLNNKKDKHLYYVDSPCSRDEAYLYEEIIPNYTVLTSILRANNKSLGIDYYKAGKNKVRSSTIQLNANDPKIGRVKTLYAPLAQDGSEIPYKKFIYDIDSDLTIQGGGTTTVLNAMQHPTYYRYDINQRITDCVHLLEGKPYAIESFYWGKGDQEGNLKARVLKDASHNVKYGRFLDYDSLGNVTEESIYGNLTGYNDTSILIDNKGCPAKNCCEHYTIRYEYSQDGLNLLLKEVHNRYEVHYTYLTGTNLKTSQITYVNGSIQKRHFWEYDEHYFAIKEIEDDGITLDSKDTQNVTQRKIKYIAPSLNFPFGLPCKIQEKYLDLTIDQEKNLSTTEYKYTARGELEEEKLFDSNGTYMGSHVWIYDDKGRVNEKYNPLAHCIKSHYDNNDNLILEVGPKNGCTVEYYYDKANRLILKTFYSDNQKPIREEYQYNVLNQRTSIIDKYGIIKTFDYDKLGRIKTISYGNTIQKYSHDIFNHVIQELDGEGNETNYERNIRGQPTKIIYADGSIKQCYYTLEGWLEKEINQIGVMTCYSYDYQGRVLNKKVYDSNQNLLSLTSFTYNAFNITSETDECGLVTLYEYDGAGRLISKKQDDKCTKYLYDTFSRQSHIIEENGSSTRLTINDFNLLGQVVKQRIEDANGKCYKITDYEYDENGNCIQSATYNAKGLSIQQYEYDYAGNLIKETDPNGNSTLYFYDKQLFTVVDPKGNQTCTLYDEKHLPLEIVYKNSLGLTLHRTINTYDKNGNKIKNVELAYNKDSIANSTEDRYIYDCLNRILSHTKAYGTEHQATIQHNYNGCGQKINTIKPDGSILFYEYNTKGELSCLKSSDNTVHYTYYYDAKGNITRVLDAINDTVHIREFDNFNNLISEILPSKLGISKTYDNLNRTKAFILPDKTSVQYEYNPIGLKTVMRCGYQSYMKKFTEYDLAGNLLSAELPLCLGKVSLLYNLSNHCVTVHHPTFQHDISYDELGNVTKNIRTQNDNKIVSNYKYDDQNQLKCEISNKTSTYEYDSLKNLTAKNGIEFLINSINQATYYNGISYKYNKNGCLIEKNNGSEITHYTYDALDRLIRVENKNGTWLYQYDFLNRRISKTHNDMTQRYLYDGNCEIGMYENGILKEFRVVANGNGPEQGGIVALELDNKIYVPLNDLFGNIVQVLNKAGAIVENIHYNAFGEEQSDQKISPWRFSSKRYDPETGFTYYGLRYYDPSIARWITCDPSGYQDGANLYTFCHNNPLRYFDPDGRFAFAIPLFAIAWGGAEVSIAYCTLQTAAVAASAYMMYQTVKSVDNYYSNYDTYRLEAKVTEGKKAKQRPDRFIGTAEDLEKDSKWIEITPPGVREKGHRMFENPETGEKIRFDKGNPKGNGHGAHDHYHHQDKYGNYLDKNGNPVPKNHNDSHLYPPPGITWIL